MNTPREKIMETLFSLLQTKTIIGGQPAFTTYSRRFIMWSDVPPASQPMLILRQLPGRVDQDNPYRLSRWTLRCGIFIYAQQSPIITDAPSVTLNNLIDCVEQSLLPPPGFPDQTLNNQVVNCYLDGEVFIDEGILPSDNQAIAMLPVTIRTGV